MVRVVAVVLCVFVAMIYAAVGQAAFVPIDLNESIARQEAERARIRMLKLQIRDRGGVVSAGFNQLTDCVAIDALTLQTAYLKMGIGEEQPSSKCWLIANGKNVNLVECSKDVDILCRFQPVIFGVIPWRFKFWAPVNAISPR